MDMQAAQADMRSAYVDGAPGVLTSALVWGAAGLSSLWLNADQGLIIFFVGGMLIHPVALLIAKLLGARGRHDPDNPLKGLAIASAMGFVGLLPVAYGIYMLKPNWFFAAMLLIIGGRYLAFATLYGMQSYWFLGGMLAVSAYPVVLFDLSFAQGAMVGALIEAGFAVHSFRALLGANKSLPNKA